VVRALAPRGGWRTFGVDGAWPEVFADADPVRYESLPSNAQRQGERLILELARQQGALHLPVFMAISADDATVDPDAPVMRRLTCDPEFDGLAADVLGFLDGTR
jgi:hypothetical protein